MNTYIPAMTGYEGPKTRKRLQGERAEIQTQEILQEYLARELEKGWIYGCLICGALHKPGQRCNHPCQP